MASSTSGLAVLSMGARRRTLPMRPPLPMRRPLSRARSMHLRCGCGGGLFGFAVSYEFESLHEAHAADVADERVFFLKLFEFSAEVSADRVSVFEEVFFFDQLDGGAGGDAGHRDCRRK